MSEINMVCMDAQISFSFPHWSVAWTDLFLCKESGSVVQNYYMCCRWSFKCGPGQGRLFGGFFFLSHTLVIDVLFFLSQTIQWLKMLFCFTPCKILWKCKSLMGRDACWPTIALVVLCIMYHLLVLSGLSCFPIPCFRIGLHSKWGLWVWS